MKKYLYLLVAALALPIHAFAWGQEGHRIIAQIAYDNLSCSARHRIEKVLGGQGIVAWCNWPDEIKSDTIYPYSHNWHYQDMNAGMSEEEVTATLTHYPAEGGQLWRATDSLKQVLRTHRNDTIALRFLIHLEGDRFCPMHMAHMDDKGGNAIKLKWFGQNKNLHSVWDTEIIKSRGYSYSEYARVLEGQLAAEKKQIRRMTAEDVILHNYQMVNSIYEHYATWDGNGYHYVYRWASEMEWQLYAAGIRLAQILEELY